MKDVQNYKELADALSLLKNGDTLMLSKGREYHVYQDDCPRFFGYHASNTATYEENPRGERPTAIFAKDKKNIVIDGCGSTLVIHGVLTPFLFDNCENLTIKNLTVDYARHTMNEYRVEASKPGEALLRMAEGCLYEITDGKLYFTGESGKDGKPYWRIPTKGDGILSMYCNPKTRQVKFLTREQGDRFPSIPTATCAEDLGDRLVKMTWQDPAATLPEGCVIQTRDVNRKQLGGLFQGCKGLLLENLTIRFMNGFGLLFQYCDSVTLRGLDCTPSQGHTIACNADFFHFSGCKGHIIIEGCKAEGAHDDFVNVHGTHLRIIEKNDKDKSLILRFENPNTRGFTAFRKNDRIDFINHSTLLPYATARVKEAELINDTDLRVILSKLPSHIDLGRDAAENATQTARLTVRGNRFGPSMGRGVLATTRRKIRIEGNEFYKLGGSVLHIADDCNFWMESGYTTDILFKGNTLTDCGYGPGKRPEPLIRVKPEITGEDSSRPVHKRLRLISNRIEGGRSFSDNEYFSIKQVIEKGTVTEQKENGK